MTDHTAREPDATITIKLWHTPLGSVARAEIDAAPSLGPAVPLALAHLANHASKAAAQIVSAATLDNADTLERIRTVPIVGSVPMPPTVREPGIGVA